MSTTLQIVDSTDLTTVLFDFNDQTGTGAWSQDYGAIQTEFGLGGSFNLARPDLAAPRFDFSDAPGGTTISARDPLVQSSFHLSVKATSYDNLAAGVGYLSRLLRAGGVMLYIPNGSSQTRYIDYEPSPAAALLDGTAFELNAVTAQFTKPEGVEVVFTRQPYLRGPELDPTLNAVTNSTLLGAAGPPASPFAPDLWAWDSTTNITATSVSAAQEAYSFTIATTGTRNLQQTTPNTTFTGAITNTFSFYAKIASGAARVTAAWQPKDNAGTNQGSEVVGTQTALTTNWQRITCTGAGNSSARKGLLSIRFANAAATAVTVYLRFAQFEAASAATLYRTGVETFHNDPAGLPGLVVPIYVQGDAPSPGKILVGGISTTSGNPRLGLLRDPSLASPTGATWMNAEMLLQAEAATQGTDTTAGTDATASPGSGNTKSTTTFANPAQVVRLTWTAASVASMAGRRMGIHARVKLSAAGQVSLYAGVGSVVPFTSTSWSIVSLGTYLFPTSASTQTWVLSASRDSGTPSLYTDWMVFSPLDELAVLTGSGGATAFLELDGETGRFGVADSTTLAFTATGTLAGSVRFDPDPGVNYLFFEHDSATLGDSSFVRFYHRPRYYG